MIDIVIAEDQTMLRDALATLLSLESDIAVAGTAATGREALDLVRRHEPAVLVTDIEMPGLTGLELAAQMRRDGARTDTERRLLRLAEAGMDSPAIAEAEGLARGTVRNYLHSAISKLGAANRIEAARLARERGWL
jgi:two-component system response regulator DesR